MENINIEKTLYPEAGELYYHEESQTFKSVIVDAELDPIEVTIMNDDTVQIHTEDYSFITLDRDSLQQLLSLMDEVETKYEELEEQE
jgi:hypothetical protein